MPYFLPKPSDSGNNRWTNNSIAELEKELELAIVEQIHTLSASILGLLHCCSVEAL